MSEFPHAFENGELVEFQLPDSMIRGRVVGYMNPTGDPETKYGFYAVKPTKSIPDFKWDVIMLPELTLRKLTVLDEMAEIGGQV